MLLDNTRIGRLNIRIAFSRLGYLRILMVLDMVAACMSPTKSEDKAEVDWSAVSKIKASERRLQIMQSLQDKPKMAGELADEYEISRKWASINLKELEELDAVVCATPEKHNYKMYRITERGEQLMEYV